MRRTPGRGRLSAGARLATAAAWLVAAATWAPPLAAQGAAEGDTRADLILVNGTVVTVDPERPRAQAVAIAGDRILAVGSDREIRALAEPSAETIDLEGRLAIPGFIEGHGHYLSLGRAKLILDLTTARSWDGIVELVAEAARHAEPGAWITGRGWHQEKWDSAPEPLIEGVPTHHALSAVSPENPVLLTHASGHAAFANAVALELAGVDAETPDPEGGEIVRGPGGEPTGLLRETAQGLVGRARAAAERERSPADRLAEMREMARLAGQEALANGVTSFHDAGSSARTVRFFHRLAEAEELPLRLYVMVRDDYETLAALIDSLEAEPLVGAADHHLTVRSIKVTIDGALGSHGAWLLEPYADLPRSSGLATTPPELVARIAGLAIANGWQLNVHAIGDRANREVLDIYERTFRAHPGTTDSRWRIEHAQHLHPDDIPRFAELGVIASFQAIHACSDGPWVIRRLGEVRAATGAYVWQELWDSGAVVTNGTDVPVEDIDPIASFHCSVTRELPDGSSFFPNQTMTREQALASYTINNAYAAFEEESKGSITPGKLADIVVLSKDIMTVPADEIRDAEVVYTIVGGEVRYRHPELAGAGRRE